MFLIPYFLFLVSRLINSLELNHVSYNYMALSPSLSLSLFLLIFLSLSFSFCVKNDRIGVLCKTLTRICIVVNVVLHNSTLCWTQCTEFFLALDQLNFPRWNFRVIGSCGIRWSHCYNFSIIFRPWFTKQIERFFCFFFRSHLLINRFFFYHLLISEKFELAETFQTIVINLSIFVSIWHAMWSIQEHNTHCKHDR